MIKKGESGTTVYVNNNYTVSNDNVISKHVFAGTSRLVTCMVTKEKVDGKETWVESGRFYTHPDHLGSSSLITNKAGTFHEQLEYFPYGEMWVQVKVSSDSYSTPYKFTGKEQDAETGLYYFGARYYDAQLSRWVSVDPALVEGKYFPEPQDFETEHGYDWYYLNSKEEKLPGLGGVFNPVNLNLYHYAGNNPVKFVDPDGKMILGCNGTREKERIVNAFVELAKQEGVELDSRSYKTFGKIADKLALARDGKLIIAMAPFVQALPSVQGSKDVADKLGQLETLFDLSGQNPRSPSYENMGKALKGLNNAYLRAMYNLAGKEALHYYKLSQDSSDSVKQEQYNNLFNFWSKVSEKFSNLME